MADNCVVVVEDDRELRDFLVEILEQNRYRVEAFPSAETALRALDADLEADLVLSDLVLPNMPGIVLLGEIRRRRPEIHVITMTAFGSIDSAIELVKAGAFDYLTKPLPTDELLLAVERALADSLPRRAAARKNRALDGAVPVEFVGSSAPMLALYRLIERTAAAPHPVLITGESGAGKELVARAIHRLSGREAFVAVNCGALPETLMESELFGHERGAFTGADRSRDGLFQVAHRGTILLDEIADLPLALQPKLLRVLEESEVRRVGSATARAVDVRVLAATNRDLEAEVRTGRFRDDLFWRLSVLNAVVPPLRERTGDIPLLVEHFLSRSGTPGVAGPPPVGFSADALAAMARYPWPGNVRELRNTVLGAATLATGDRIGLDELPARVRDASRVAPLLATARQRRLSLAELELLYIRQVLEEAGGNKSKAAEILGLDRKTLHRKLDEQRDTKPGTDA